MNVGTSSALLLFQDAAGTASDLHWIAIFTGVIAVCILIVLLVAALGGMVAYFKITKLSHDAQKRAQPLLAKGQQIAGTVNDILGDLKPRIATISADLQPKIASVSADVQHISSLVRSKMDEAGSTFTHVNQTVHSFTETAQDVNKKTRGQVDRVNVMVSDALTTTQQVSLQIQHGIRVPIEKIASWVTAAKIGVENLAEKLPFISGSTTSRSASSTAQSRRPSTPGPVPVDSAVVVTRITED